MQLLTFGHGTASAEDLAALIHGAGVTHVVDVRRVPRSRRHPHVATEEMQRWVPQLAGAAYTLASALGGFRKPRPDSPNVSLRHPAFRGYADYMETQAFANALDALLEIVAAQATAVMCSESLWWRCHRRLIADAASLLHQLEVRHLFANGKLVEHVPTSGVRVLDSHRLRYDV